MLSVVDGFSLVLFPRCFEKVLIIPRVVMLQVGSCDLDDYKRDVLVEIRIQVKLFLSRELLSAPYSNPL